MAVALCKAMVVLLMGNLCKLWVHVGPVLIRLSRGQGFKSLQAEICVKISVPSAPPSQLSYNDYTDCRRLVER